MKRPSNPAILVLIALFAAPVAKGQSLDTPMTRLRPIGTPSAVDQYRAVDQYQPIHKSGGMYQETGYGVRQAAMQFALPPMPSSGPVIAAPPTTAAPTTAAPPSIAIPPRPMFNNAPLPPSPMQPTPLPPSSMLPQATTIPPRSLPPPPVSSSDLSPIAPPQLGGGGYATMYNCSNVSPASGYSAASGIGCGQATYQAPVGYGPVLAPNVYAPPNVIAAPPTTIIPSGTGAPIGPLMSFGQSANPVQVGPGLFGQPKAYVPGQGVRNWLRYFTP